MYTQQLKEAVARWRGMGDAAGETKMMERIVLVQFSEWVRCHWLGSLKAAITLAEDFLAVHSGGSPVWVETSAAVHPILVPRSHLLTTITSRQPAPARPSATV